MVKLIFPKSICICEEFLLFFIQKTIIIFQLIVSVFETIKIAGMFSDLNRFACYKIFYFYQLLNTNKVEEFLLILFHLDLEVQVFLSMILKHSFETLLLFIESVLQRLPFICFVK